MIARRTLLGAAGALAASRARASDEAPVVELSTDSGRHSAVAQGAAAHRQLPSLRGQRAMQRGHPYRAARARGVQDLGLIEGCWQNDPAKLFPPDRGSRPDPCCADGRQSMRSRLQAGYRRRRRSSHPYRSAAGP